MEWQPAQVGIWRTSMRCVGLYAWRSGGSKLRLGPRVCCREELTSQIPGRRCLRLFFAMILSRIVKLLMMRNKLGLWCHLLQMDYLGFSSSHNTNANLFEAELSEACTKYKLALV